MIKHLSMKPTGWFQIGWSAEVPPGAVKPLKYFGQDLVAFRTRSGKLSVLDAHCLHMGAHLGYGGKVSGDCIACPYHGWQWRTDGTHALIPYEGHTISKPLRAHPIVEQHEIIFMWHDPNGGPPRAGWLPHLFDFPGHPAASADFYSCYSNQTYVWAPNERIHPQLIVENSADCMHFRYSHGAPEDPVLLSFDADGPVWRSEMAFRSPKTKEFAMHLYSHVAGVGLSFTVFDHSAFGRRLVLANTPIDDETSDLRVSYFFPKDPLSPEIMPEQVHETARQTRVFFEQDAQIWRHQKFVQRPIFARQDVKAYTALRKWSDQFYEKPDAPVGPMAVVPGD
jgi:3-ketosteroid 9alpha-monooxygenase subunit A